MKEREVVLMHPDGGRTRLTAGIAATWRERSRGFAGVSDETDAILFRFPFRARWPMWMKGVARPLAILWLDGETVIGVERRTAPCCLREALAISLPPRPVRMVLEVDARLLLYVPSELEFSGSL